MKYTKYFYKIFLRNIHRYTDFNIISYSSIYLHLKNAVFIYIAIIFLIHTAPASASPWPRAPGSIFTTIGIDEFQASGDFVFDVPPLIDSLEDMFRRTQTRSYIEYGISKKWLATFKTAYSFTRVMSPNSLTSSNGFSEIEGSIQRQVWRTPNNVLSLAIAVGQNNSFSGGTRPGLESDGIDGEFRALYGRFINIAPFPVFATGELAYRRRFGSAADQIRADFKIGVEPHNRILLLLDTFTVTSVRNNEQGGADFDVIKLQPSIALRVVKGWRVQGGITYEIYDRNLDGGRGYFINLWSKF